MTDCAQLSGVAAAKKTAQPTKEESESDSDEEMEASKDKGRGMIKQQQRYCSCLIDSVGWVAVVVIASGTSYYKHIAGQKYDRGLLDLADALVKSTTEGRLNKQCVQQLVEDTMDGSGMTDCERLTLKYIQETYQCTSDGEDEFSSRLPASPLCSLDSAQAKKKTAKDDSSDSSDSDEEMKMVGLEKEELLLTKPVAEPARGEPSAFMKLMTLVTLTWCDLVQ